MKVLFLWDLPNQLEPLLHAHAQILDGIAHPFRLAGHECFVCAGAYPPEDLYLLCDELGVDVVFEVNRSRRKLTKLRKEIIHIAWWLDAVKDDFYLGSCSDLNYYAFPFDDYHLSAYSSDFFHDSLEIGFDPRVFYPAKRSLKKQNDIAFVGNICRHFAQFSKPDICIDPSENTDRLLSLKELYEHFKENFHYSLGQYQVSTIHKTLEAYLLEKSSWKEGQALSANLLRTVDNVLVKHIEREQYIERLSKVSHSLAIYGLESWQEWPQFSPYYKGFISDARQLCSVYRKSKLNFHHGCSGLHFRLLDCMAAGQFILINENDPHKKAPQAYFQAGEHFAEYKKEELEEVASFYLENEALREEIGAKAAKLVHAEHSWEKRVAKILKLL